MTDDIIITKTRLRALKEHDARERAAREIMDGVVSINSDAPRHPSLKFTSAVTLNILHIFRSMGGFGLHEPDEVTLEGLKKKKLAFRAFYNPDIASRARRPLLDTLYEESETIPKGALRPIFINSGHYPNQNALAALRQQYASSANQFIGEATTIQTLMREAAGEVTEFNGHKLTREQRISLFLYREVEGEFTVRTNNNLMLREEVVHSLQTMLKVPYRLMRSGLMAQHDTPAFLKRTLIQSRAEQTAKRDADEETAFERAERRLNYLWNDREMQARLDKVFCEAGVFPKNTQEAMRLLEDLGLALGGIKDLQHRSIWERSMIKGHCSRALAELNYAMIAGFPDGVTDFFKDVALPYHIAQTARVNSFDKDYSIVKQYGFEYHEQKYTRPDSAEKRIHGLKPIGRAAIPFAPK